MKSYGSTSESNGDLLSCSLRAPTFSNQTLSSNIIIEEIHCVIDGLLFQYFGLPSLQGTSYSRKDLNSMFMTSSKYLKESQQINHGNKKKSSLTTCKSCSLTLI